MGDPVLRTPAAPVVDFDAELRQLVADLTDTMHAAGGAGIAAPQIGVGLRVFTWYVDGPEVGHLVNPDVYAGGRGDRGGRPEGCRRPRASASTAARHRRAARRLNMHGDPIRVEGTHKPARCIEHETDHLDGVLFVDRLDDEAVRSRRAALQEAPWIRAPAQPPLRPAPPDVRPVPRVSPHCGSRSPDPRLPCRRCRRCSTPRTRWPPCLTRPDAPRSRAADPPLPGGRARRADGIPTAHASPTPRTDSSTLLRVLEPDCARSWPTRAGPSGGARLPTQGWGQPALLPPPGVARRRPATRGPAPVTR